MATNVSTKVVATPAVNTLTAANGTAATVSSGARAIVDVGASFNQTTLNNIVKTIQTEHAALVAALVTKGIITAA
jgi:hypothetical protein